MRRCSHQKLHHPPDLLVTRGSEGRSDRNRFSEVGSPEAAHSDHVRSPSNLKHQFQHKDWPHVVGHSPLGQISVLYAPVPAQRDPIHCRTTFSGLPTERLLTCPAQLRISSSTAAAPDPAGSVRRRLQIPPTSGRLRPTAAGTDAAQPLPGLGFPGRSGSAGRASPPRERAPHSVQSSLAAAEH